MKPSTIYSKSGKGVQEASGKTSLLKRADRAVLSAIDGRATLGEVAQKVGKSFDAEFEKLIAQLDKEGFVREVAAAASSAASQSRPAVATAKPAAKAPAAKASSSSSSSGGADDLDFTTIMPAIKPAARPLAPAAAPSKAQVSDAAMRAKEQESALYKARQEAEAKAQAERDRIKQEAEAKARGEAEAKAKLDAENRLREEAIGRAKAAAEAQVKAARAKVEAEAQAKLEVERKMREEVERKVREEAERALREAEALRQRLEEERKAREEVERKRREEEEERRAREEAERKRREEEERKRREEEEKKRLEEEERRLRAEIEAKAREAAELARREAEDRMLREKEEQVRRAKEAEEARMLQARAMEEARLRVRQRERERDQDEPRGRKSKDETRVAQPTLPAAAAPAAPGDGSLDALMADLDSFSQREEEERQSREAAERESREEGKRKSQAEAERRAQEDAERQMREQLEREAREQEERQRRDEEERRAREEADRRRLEAEESRRLEAEERKRKAQEALLAKAAPLPDLDVSDKDLGMDEVRRDEAAVARDARKAQREREREARQRAKEAKEHAKAAEREASSVKYPKVRRKVNWGRPLAVTLLTLLAAGLVALHIIPLPMDDYERAASDALGRSVKIGTGRLSLYSGLRLNLEGLSVDGSTTIAQARAYPSLRALIEGRQVLDRLELSGVTLPQSAIGAVVGAKLRGEGFRGARIFAKDVRLTGPVQLPVVEAEARIGPDGAVASVVLSGPESLSARLTPTASGEVEFDVTAANLTVPFVPELTLSPFAMKGVANRQGMNIASWGGGVLDGAVSGAANLRWSGAWQLEGGLTARAINAALFAPALLSEGKAEGQARFSMSGKDPAKLSNAAYLEGNFSVGKGVLGTVDLARVLHTGGRQYGGRTQFTEMTGHATYDRGAVALRSVNISAGALTAGASADIAPSGAIAGRIVADIRTTVQPLRAILVIGGTVKEPQVRN